MNKKTILKISGCIFTAAAAVLMLVLLGRQVGVSNRTEEINPPLFDSPSYVEPGSEGSLTVKMTAKDNVMLGSFNLVMVNTESSGTGSVRFTMTDGTEELWSLEAAESDISVGEWFSIDNPPTYFESGKTYEMLIEPADCDPYFIKTQLYSDRKSVV